MVRGNQNGSVKGIQKTPSAATPKAIVAATFAALRRDN